MLQENTLFGLYDKEQEVMDFLREHEPPEGYFVAFSGGKDSIVALDLVRRSGVKHIARYNMTTVEPPELVYFIRDNYPDIWEHRIRPKKSMWELIEKNGMPTMKMRFCCKTQKETGGRGFDVVTGVRAQESARRAKRKRWEVKQKDKKHHFAHILISWTESEVWEYIKKYDMPYCKLYDEGFHRVGCIMCPFGGWRRIAVEIERYPRYAALYKKYVTKHIEYKKQSGSPPKLWQTGEEYFDWWLNLTKKKTIVESCDMVPLFSADDDEYFL